MGCICSKNVSKEEKEIKTFETNQADESQIVRDTPKSRQSLASPKHFEKEDYIQTFINNLNFARTRPADYAEVVREAKTNIVPSPNTPSFKDAFDKKVSLLKGDSAFEECIRFLNSVKPLAELKRDDSIAAQIPLEKDKWASFDYINALWGAKQEELEDKFSCYSFHFQVGTKDSASNVLLQVVDDSGFNLKRRDNIFNPDFTSVGLSVAKHKSKVCNYLVFGG